MLGTPARPRPRGVSGGLVPQGGVQRENAQEAAVETGTVFDLWTTILDISFRSLSDPIRACDRWK